MMNTLAEIEDVLHRFDYYKRAYKEDEQLIKRLLGVRAVLFSLLKHKWHKTSARRVTESVEPVRCWNCDGTGIVAPPKWMELADKLSKHRPPANVLIDQCPVTAVDLARRVGMMYDLGDIRHKKILCIGDNDFASILISIVGEPKGVVVVEIDDRVIEILNSEAQKGGLPISVLKLDIRSIQKIGCPEELLGQFDVFETDPPYTEVGMKFYAFLGMQALKRYGIGYIVVPHMSLESWSDELMFSVQGFLLQNGFVLTDVIPRSQTFQHEFEVISTVIRCKRLSYVSDIQSLKYLSIDRFYTIRDYTPGVLA